MFHRPHNDGTLISYFCGHSLGLQPLATKDYLELELNKWARQGVEGHFDEPNPWFHYHKFLRPGLSHLCGAKESEVAAYGSLSSNLHFLLASFYRPSKSRFKILSEGISFPSDRFALQTHVAFRGLEAKEAIVWLKHDEDYCFSTDYIVSEIEKHGETLALVWLSGVNFLSGQVLDMLRIAKAANQYGIKIGIDLAHALGNVPLQLHDWGIDFAVWCSYKYLNAGPGATGGYFVHEKNHPSPQLTTHNSHPIPLLGGWWGHEESTRFQTEQDFHPISGADAWQHSNANVLSLAPLRASLDLFLIENVHNLHERSLEHTEKAISLLKQLDNVQVLTPQYARGNMVSLLLKRPDKRTILEKLKAKHISADWREPGILRFSFCPLYNSKEEWDDFIQSLQEML